MHPLLEHAQHLTRRQFFGATGLRLGGTALALLASGYGARHNYKQESASNTATIRRTHECTHVQILISSKNQGISGIVKLRVVISGEIL